ASLTARHLGNPAALSGHFSSQLSAFIIQNNIRVAALACVLGLLLGLPTVALLLANGFQLGVLASASHGAGLDLQFWALIVPHGVIELTVICTAAGAGLRLGDSLLRPGLQTRGGLPGGGRASGGGAHLGCGLPAGGGRTDRGIRDSVGAAALEQAAGGTGDRGRAL
ncbi:membrane protein containing DUF95, transmembrane, partial [mine drainage metagenome]